MQGKKISFTIHNFKFKYVENDALSWPNNDASFEELFETDKTLSRELG